MSKRRKKNFRPKRRERDRTPEPVTVSAEKEPIEEAIVEEPRRRSDSLEPVACLVHREAALTSEEEIPAEHEEIVARDASRPPARFVPVVRNVVAACALIALAGGARATLKHVRAAHEHAMQTAAASPPRPDVMPDEEEDSAPAEAAQAPQPDVDLYDPVLAATLAERSRMKLEKRDVLDAIELGEQAVLHDAKNARAWVVLGAAYQQHGDMASARNCYRMCVRGAQVSGDKSREDCAAMLQK